MGRVELLIIPLKGALRVTFEKLILGIYGGSAVLGSDISLLRLAAESLD